ncbi:hypothetical protein A6E13_16595 [Aliivibrio fischeri]|uniref:hypothetical protein n=1 Tax=Aliivibrio fischeri TaxID=668 RepID=UPI00080ECD91|nr:hypothetical protein [Aliivibrio fischeri]OCH31838.1 hypothetical protein A6E13_16595 [Aliivibrio fischeri]
MTMTLMVWPEHRFGLPRFEPYELRQQSNLLTTAMASGRPRSRRISRNVPTLMTAEWTIHNDDRDAFAGYIEYALQGGAVWFTMRVKTGNTLREHEVKFETNPLESEKPGINKTTFKSTIRIRKLHRSSDEEVVGAVLAPMSLDEIVEGTEMNRYYTESWK